MYPVTTPILPMTAPKIQFVLQVTKGVVLFDIEWKAGLGAGATAWLQGLLRAAIEPAQSKQAK